MKVDTEFCCRDMHDVFRVHTWSYKNTSKHSQKIKQHVYLHLEYVNSYIWKSKNSYRLNEKKINIRYNIIQTIKPVT